MSRIAWIELKFLDILLSIISSGILDLHGKRQILQHIDHPYSPCSIYRFIEDIDLKFLFNQLSVNALIGFIQNI